jgi:2,5-diketo-D-gluconate reductase A
VLSNAFTARRERTIGVSNFRIEDLEALERQTATRPTVNQIELHPRLQQAALRAWHGEHGIATEAWSPFAQGEALGDPAIVAIAASHAKAPAQVILRWQLELGDVVIPKSVTPERIRQNIDIFAFELSAEELSEIGRLDRGGRIGPNPATFVTPSSPLTEGAPLIRMRAGNPE